MKPKSAENGSATCNSAEKMHDRTTDDLISRQAAIDTATEYENQLYEILGDENELAEAVKILKHRIIALQPAQPEPKWILCSERLPEDDGAYIVSGKWMSGKVSVGECEYCKHDGYFRTAWNFDVIAWMPLPEPYQEEGEQDD